MKKKFLLALLCAAFMVTAAACGGTAVDSSPGSDSISAGTTDTGSSDSGSSDSGSSDTGSSDMGY